MLLQDKAHIFSFFSFYASPHSFLPALSPTRSFHVLQFPPAESPPLLSSFPHSRKIAIYLQTQLWFHLRGGIFYYSSQDSLTTPSFVLLLDLLQINVLFVAISPWPWTIASSGAAYPVLAVPSTLSFVERWLRNHLPRRHHIMSSVGETRSCRSSELHSQVCHRETHPDTFPPDIVSLGAPASTTVFMALILPLQKPQVLFKPQKDGQYFSQPSEGGEAEVI